ncbi:MAG: PEP-CTERM system TPR-repeat protein PrsT, partial [Geobacter sp.]|nr:PEP-CTERM system TPR-repeat protein PrsT [Geobacter sp.]
MIKYILVALTVLLLAGCGGKSKEELCAKGKEELGRGNPNGAIVFFKKALEVDQNFAEAREQLATAYIDSGRFEGAERELKKLNVQFPQKLELKLQLAKVYNSTRKPDDALKLLDEYLAQKPADSVALEYKGISFALKKDGNEAERFFLQALQINPGNFEAKLELALVYAASGRDASARKLIDEVITAKPDNAKAYNLLAQMELARGNKAKALDVYRKLSDISKNDPMPLYRMGLMYLELGDMPKAEQVSSELARRFSKSGESARFAGILSFKKKSYTEAIAALQNSLKIQPTLDGYYYLGMTYYVSGQLESAISQFRAILDRFPNHSRSRIMIGMILLQQKRLDDAMAEMRKVIDEDHGNAFAHNVMGSVLIAKGLVDEGIREFNRAIELDPSIVDAHVKKGLISLGRGQEREGEAELIEAINVKPDLLNSRMLLFSYYMKRNNPRKAESIILRGLTGKPSDAPLYNALAGAELSQGKIDESLQNFRKA